MHDEAPGAGGVFPLGFHRHAAAGTVVEMRRIARWAGVGLLALVAAFLVGRAVVEVIVVDPSDAATYRDDWGGPTYLGVLAVHAGPGLIVLAVLVWWWLRAARMRRERGPAQM
jgi:hypothetical protein